MSLAPFAAIEQRINRVVFERLSNVSTTLAGAAVQGIFDSPHEQAHVGGAGMASSRPTFTLPTASVPLRVTEWFSYAPELFDPTDLHLDIAGITYQVVAHEPDGAGVSVLVLERT